jgi:hypothetical protein
VRAPETHRSGPCQRAVATPAKLLVLAALCGAAWPQLAQAEPKTVCTITVNSSDEKEAFRRSLPPDKYRFVELVERGRPDWLASACKQRIRCDVLILSGHFDGYGEFYSDRPGTDEYLPIDEMERASCSNACSSLFSHLKEVYLFGCNTLNPEALKRPAPEIGRSLVRAGYSPNDAERMSRALGERYGESSRDRMRMIFKGVPVIYGFSAKAPLGPLAGSMLAGYFRSGPRSDVGSGRVSSRLLGHFARTSMAVSRGMSDADPLSAFRRDVCQLADDGLSPAHKLRFIHGLFGHEMAEVGMNLDRVEKYVASLTEADWHTPEVAQAREEIVRDREARARYLAFVRDAREPAARVRMIGLARRLGWLSPDEERAELTRMIGERLAQGPNSEDVDLVCALNSDHRLDRELGALQASGPASTAARAGVLACLGSAEARAQVLLALVSSSESENAVAQAYLSRRPITDVNELRELTAAVARMGDAKAQVRALDALADLHLSDRESVEALTRLFPVAKTPAVQVAIADVLLRADYEAIAAPGLVETLQESRLQPKDDTGVIDALIRRLEVGSRSSEARPG